MGAMTIKLGVIGLSEGNGHPYSWGAIVNGYDPLAMQACGFPTIPRYLAEQSWPEAQLQGARVEWVWTQSPELSRRVASASCIPNVATHLEEMLPAVDALLLARDDAENHLQFAAPFLAAGKPVYIDKPVALSLEGLEELYALEQFPGQIFSCSALRYSGELQLSVSDREMLGDIREIHAVTPKSWRKYSAHIIEPVLNMLGASAEPAHIIADKRGEGAALTVEWSNGTVTRLFALSDASSPIMFRVHGAGGYKELKFTDSFTAFRAALADFVEGIETRTVRTPYAHLRRVVTLIEAGDAP